MPINIPNKLPAKVVLDKENVFVITNLRAHSQDIRPLKVALLNLMPTKISTETQILRLLSNTALQVSIDLVQTGTYTSKNTPTEHLVAFYKTFDQIKHNKYDGLIITGAPVETMKFEDVLYWDELKEILDWAKTNVFSCFFICWGAQAALYHYYKIPKHQLDKKMFGVFEHDVKNKHHVLMRGFDDVFLAPHSRHTEVRAEDILKCNKLELLSASNKAGVYIAASKDKRQIFITGHSEYDADVLANEYFRDVEKGLKIDIPYNYFPENNVQKAPNLTWRSHAYLLYANWLNYCIYQSVPYDFIDTP